MTIVKRLQSWAAPLSRFHSHKVGFHRITEWFGLGGTFKGPVPILSCGLKCSGLCLNRAEVPSSVGCEQGKQSRSPGCQGVTVPSPGSASATELEMELTALWQLWWDGHQRRSWRGSRNLCHLPTSYSKEVITQNVPEKARYLTLRDNRGSSVSPQREPAAQPSFLKLRVCSQSTSVPTTERSWLTTEPAALLT